MKRQLRSFNCDYYYTPESASTAGIKRRLATAEANRQPSTENPITPNTPTQTLVLHFELFLFLLNA
jgi:hypothetical protein